MKYSDLCSMAEYVHECTRRVNLLNTDSTNNVSLRTICLFDQWQKGGIWETCLKNIILAVVAQK